MTDTSNNIASNIASNIPTEIKLNIEDNASLIFFTNPHYLSILRRKKLSNITDNVEKMKFYRKRIVSLFKELFKPTEEVNKEIKELHTFFVNATIRYFEVTDKKDIIQEQYQTPEGLEKTPEDVLNDIGGCELYSIAEANDMMMRKTITLANLDNYVISKQDISKNEMRIIPMKIEIDLKTNDLKTKGVRKKSKNMKEDLSN
jgi:hypothetical protein